MLAALRSRARLSACSYRRPASVIRIAQVGRSVVMCVLGDHGMDGQRTVMTTESCSACHEWSMPGPQVT